MDKLKYNISETWTFQGVFAKAPTQEYVKKEPMDLIVFLYVLDKHMT